MAIKINLMPKAQKKGWQIPQGDLRLHSIAFLLFIFSLLAFAGIYAYKNYFLQKQLDELNKQNSDLVQTISNSLDSNLIYFGRRAKNTEVLLKNHLYWSKYFETLESLTLKNIYYDQFSVKTDLLKNTAIQADISGHTESFNALSKQAAIFMKSKDFSNVEFDGGEMDKDGVIKFKIGLEISQDLLKEKNGE